MAEQNNRPRKPSGYFQRLAHHIQQATTAVPPARRTPVSNPDSASAGESVSAETPGIVEQDRVTFVSQVAKKSLTAEQQPAQPETLSPHQHAPTHTTKGMAEPPEQEASLQPASQERPVGRHDDEPHILVPKNLQANAYHQPVALPDSPVTDEVHQEDSVEAGAHVIMDSSHEVSEISDTETSVSGESAPESPNEQTAGFNQQPTELPDGVEQRVTFEMFMPDPDMPDEAVERASDAQIPEAGSPRLGTVISREISARQTSPDMPLAQVTIGQINIEIQSPATTPTVQATPKPEPARPQNTPTKAARSTNLSRYYLRGV